MSVNSKRYHPLTPPPEGKFSEIDQIPSPDKFFGQISCPLANSTGQIPRAGQIFQPLLP